MTPKLFLLLGLALLTLASCKKDDPDTIPDNILEAIPDERFRSFCIDFDLDWDGKVSAAEAQAVSFITLFVPDIMGVMKPYKVGSVEGIQYFTEIEWLSCGRNSLKELDISRNLKLTHVLCRENNLKELDISNNISLQVLECSNNPDLKTIWVWQGFNLDNPEQSIPGIYKDTHTVFRIRE